MNVVFVNASSSFLEVFVNRELLIYEKNRDCYFITDDKKRSAISATF